MQTKDSRNQLSQNRGRILALIILISILLKVDGASVLPVSIVNIPSPSPAGGGGDSIAPIISPDGRYVLFASSANNLTLINSINPTVTPVPPVMNVYLRDRLNQTTTLVSISADGNGAGNGDSFPAGISTNGRYALFESAASNLISGDTNGVNDIFIRDLVANTTTLVSVSTNGTSANGVSRSSVMTPDGRYVAFVSAATNLVAGDANGIPDVFVRDTQNGITTLASTNALAQTTASSSELPQITPDGRYVTFYSTATNLVRGVTNSGEIYLADLLQKKTLWASTNTRAVLQSLGKTAQFSCDPLVSSNGQFVVYEACPASGNGVVLRYNVATGLTDIVNTNAAGVIAGSELVTQNFAITPDGRYVSFLGYVDGINTFVAVWDGQSQTTTYACVDTNQTPVTNSICDWLSFTPDGRYVAFTSNATNLTANLLATDFHIYIRDLLTGSTLLMDADTNAIGTAKNLLPVPGLSDDGSTVSFASFDSSLVANDNNRAYDVFVRNRNAASAELVSAGLPGLPSLASDASCSFSSACVSSNGQVVAFWTLAGNLTGGDTNLIQDIYARNLATGTNFLVSVNTNGIAGNAFSLEPAISGNGRFVAFTSYASDLVTNNTGTGTNIFLRDLQAGTTTLVSVGTDGQTPGNNSSYTPGISTDGRYVLYFSKASNLVPGLVANAGGNLFWRDLQSGTNRAVTTFASSATVLSITAAMSPDGQLVVYGVQTNNSLNNTLYVWSAAAGNIYATNHFSSAITRTAISPDGNLIACYLTNQFTFVNLAAKTQVSLTNTVTRPGCQFSADSSALVYTLGTNQIYLYNFASSNNTLITPGANGICDSPTIAAGGRFVAYRSYASNLTPNDTNGWADIFLYDSQLGTTRLITVSPFNNAGANGLSLNPVFSADGQTLFWQSWANNLAPQTFNQYANIFALQSFATNSGGPAGSFAITSFGLTSLYGFATTGNAATLAWTLGTNTNYQVQFTTNLANPQWQTLTNASYVLGNQGYLLDTGATNGQRFYRVIAF